MGDSDAAGSPRGWNRMISSMIMRDMRSGVQLSSARRGWSFERASAVGVEGGSRFAGRAIAGIGTAGPGVVRSRDARVSELLVDSIAQRTRVAKIIGIGSVSGGSAVVTHAAFAWRISVPGI